MGWCPRAWHSPVGAGMQMGRRKDWGWSSSPWVPASTLLPGGVRPGQGDSQSGSGKGPRGAVSGGEGMNSWAGGPASEQVFCKILH